MTETNKTPERLHVCRYASNVDATALTCSKRADGSNPLADEWNDNYVRADIHDGLHAELAQVKSLLLRFSDEVAYVSGGPVHWEVLVWRESLDAKEKPHV